jgi:formylglycine-generating enzyme
MRALLGLAVALSALSPSGVFAESPMARVGPGVLRPVYAPEPGVTEIQVPAFALDRVPVTNGEFLAFVAAHPKWQRGRVATLFADAGYLAHWASPTSLGDGAHGDQPVTGVSWFAARAYCAALGKRLPTENEWELAAAAGAHGPDGRAEPGFRAAILARTTRPAGQALAAVGRDAPNFWRVQDLHGLVWEWVLDFNATMITGDSRDGKSAETMRFCGAGAFAGDAKDDYASFMRVAFRSSLEARYTATSLGFRCARDVEGASR